MKHCIIYIFTDTHAEKWHLRWDLEDGNKQSIWRKSERVNKVKKKKKKTSTCECPEPRVIATPLSQLSVGDKVQEVSKNQVMPSLIQAWLFLEMLK